MDILTAIKELRDLYDMDTAILDPGGQLTTIVEAWQRESEQYEEGHTDPNEYHIDIANGIVYVNEIGQDAGFAYRILTRGGCA